MLRQLKSMCLSMLLIDKDTLTDLEHIQEIKEMMRSPTTGTNKELLFERIP